jgi:hypothetical protein
MRTDLHGRIRSYVAGLDVPLPVDVSQIITRAGARPNTVRRWRVPLAGAVATPAPAADRRAMARTGWHGLTDRPGADDTVPDRIAGYSYLTSSVSKSPPGRAIALYTHGEGVELFDFPQALVLSADGDVYRRVDLAERRAGPQSQGDPAPMQLSPDGRRVAVGSIADAGDLALLDLSTGTAVTRPARSGANINPLAWSPNGRYLAALEIVGDPGAFPGRLMHGPLVLYDVDSSAQPRRFADYPDVDQVTFSPDSTELAVQSTDSDGTFGIIPAPTSIPIIDLSGQWKRTLTLPAGYGLASGTAWSPDGRLLALDGQPPTADSIETLTFLDPSGAGRAVPAPVVVSGYSPSPAVWTGPDRLLVRATGKNSDNTNVVVELNLTSGERRQITWVDTGFSDNYGLGYIEFATGLLANVKLRPTGPPDRGPWPQWLRIALVISAAVLVVVLALFIRLVHRRSRRRLGTPVGAFGAATKR